jgi:tetratricopeptide (TPR) repeat protein
MMRKFATLIAAVLVTAAGMCLAAPFAMAQNMGSLVGQVKDLEGKPFPDVTLIMKNDESGLTFTVKTDKNGNFTQIGMRPGIYSVTCKAKDKVIYETKVRVTSGEEAKLNLNFKELQSQESSERQAARKKQEEESKKFEGMRGHFDAGRAKMEEARVAKAEMMKAPADQRAPMQEKLNATYQEAINELDLAVKAAPEKEPNLPILYYTLASVYDAAGKNDEAIAAYQKAIELKPTEAGYYNNLGNVLARVGKIPEAGQAYEKSASLDPANAASAWLNFGIVLYNANRLKDASEPLRKATALSPKNADAWYLLGASLLASIDSKQDKDGKLTYVIQPGTAEAYQKYLELAPTGRFANDAKAALSGLEALGAGVETKVKVRKKG